MQRDLRLPGLLIALAAAASAAPAAPVPGQGTWDSTLHARDLDGDGSADAFYDSTLDVTWLRRWDLTGATFHGDAMAWAATLSIGGVGGWRLPTMVDTGAPGCQFSTGGTDCGYNPLTAGSEMAHLFFVTLGNLAFYAPGDPVDGSPQAGWGLTNTAFFEGMQEVQYWTGVDVAAAGAYAWSFWMGAGWQGPANKLGYEGYAIVHAVAVRDGDVGTPVPVPEPATAALAAIALLAAATTRRRRAGPRLRTAT